MDITSKFIYAKTREAFERELPNIPQGLNPIVFIEDTKEMWTLGTYFSIGYPNFVITETGGVVNVAIGNSSFYLATSGDSLSIRKGTDNRIILTSTALTRVDTALPLEWDSATKKLLHSTSGVTSGTYGQTSSVENASIFSIPYFMVDSYGHIKEAGSKNVEIRDYVEQLAPSTSATNRNVLLSYNDTSSTSDTAQTRKANGLLFNDASGILSVPGGLDVNGRTNITGGDLTVVGGYIVGDLKGNVTGSATPKIHLSSEPEYGGASTELYGHVKVQDTLGVQPPLSSDNSDPNSATVTNGVAASPRMVWDVREELRDEISGGINAAPSIGGIDVGNQSIEITVPNQRVEIITSAGIKASVNNGDLYLSGVGITAYDNSNTQKAVDDNLDFTDDFIISSDNKLSIRWEEIPN